MEKDIPLLDCFGTYILDEMGDSVMKVEELVFFPTQLVHVETIRFNAEKKLEKAGMKYRIKAETRGEVVDEKMGKSYIKICVENNGYYFEEEKVGVFNSQKKLQMKSRQCNLWKFRVSVYCGRTLEKICIQYHQNAATPNNDSNN